MVVLQNYIGHFLVNSVRVYKWTHCVIYTLPMVRRIFLTSLSINTFDILSFPENLNETFYIMVYVLKMNLCKLSIKYSVWINYLFKLVGIL